jgi:ketosteroid isomerase-like protein
MLKTFDRFVHNYNERNLDATLSMFRDSPPAVAFGTGADEKRRGLTEIKEQLIRDWSQSDSDRLAVLHIDHEQDGDFGWLAVELKVSVNTDQAIENLVARGTFVMERKHGEDWKIAHMHVSLPSSEQAAGKSFPNKST